MTETSSLPGASGTPSSTTAPTANPEREPLVRVTDLRIQLGHPAVDLVRGVSLTVPRGGTVAVVGESGSGKSLTALSLIGLLPPGVTVRGGEIRFQNRSLTHLSEREWESVRGAEIAMIFQDPLSSLNPAMRVGTQIAEMFRRRAGLSRRDALDRAVHAMAEVGIPDPGQRATAYPHEFSGGMRQRVMIAMALALRPKLLIADEPTTALDVTVQAQIMRLLTERKRTDGLTMILISHDLGVVARTADRVAVMYAGSVVESGPCRDVLATPAHPYTQGLLRAVPDRRRPRGALEAIPGQPPDPRALPTGCAFHPRCPIAQSICRTVPPQPVAVTSTRTSACHFATQVFASERVEGGERP
ncbi:ABC transporter ATP-binding protein [Thermasporomyces composti]|jgi:oligopeptide/dipeptide ABC transporter ATP-binding protein|uniref:Peptide/nickel transport system ATP-binding protein/oligopeptide transport system ATP-binding protein n=1 Tax=Thermasporomyces composti TaxID=696763 RepID=A0A3D9V9B5_THECX|nr:ABC transporter ATP-binding protein [Thermasporomyces composti]REF34754.1 peptide/nickel transport system ATP-binding protein/oligopeptide transport system ATP-binding protein [Thermasporomyces composti]